LIPPWAVPQELLQVLVQELQQLARVQVKAQQVLLQGQGWQQVL